MGTTKQGGLRSHLGFFAFGVLVDNFVFFSLLLVLEHLKFKSSWSSIVCSQVDGDIHGIVNARTLLIPPTAVLFSQRLSGTC